MKKMTRRNRVLDDDQRRPYETASPTTAGDSRGQATRKLPEWCNVYEGLSDEDIAEVESVALRRSDTGVAGQPS